VTAQQAVLTLILVPPLTDFSNELELDMMRWGEGVAGGWPLCSGRWIGLSQHSFRAAGGKNNGGSDEAAVLGTRGG